MRQSVEEQSAKGQSPAPPHRGPGAGRVRRLAAKGRAAVVAVALLAVWPLAGTPASADTVPSRADVYRALGIGDQPADYVVLVDTSGSMAGGGRYSTVRSTLRPFLDGLSPRDHVALVTFDSRPEARYIGSAGNTDAIMARLPAAPDPGGETDIGAALETALRELERPGAPEIASVVLLTDGEHHPPGGSRYPKATGPAWDGLRTRAGAVGKRAELAGYALPLGSGATGAELLGSVVRDTSVMRPDSVQDLGAYLKRAGERIRARKAGLLLARDLGKGVTVSWADGAARDVTGGSATASVTFRSTTERVPLTISQVSAALGGASLGVGGLPSRITLRPGESKTYTVRLEGELPAGPLPYRRTEKAGAALRVSGRVTSDWEQALAPDVRLDVPGRVRTTGRDLPLRATVGSAAFLPALLAGVTAALLAVWLWWRRTNRPRLLGELLLAPAFGGALPDRIALSGRRVALRPRAGGRGTVHGRRRRTGDGPQVDLLIRYTPDGSADRESRATCGPGRQVVVNGVSFTYLPAQWADGLPSFTGRPQ
ncbi:VWA domain-containing protein [Streptomyces telluris]|uniref:VWA domain-containing protein n=1 Tax=Streptomyces telluris TaxID=2720021 RepID=A0A9X2LMK4_9ACTN|nr:vWA domain-containing protein [Streptomyces telluris]MCQ8773920.1 VWA domain-containing protein [Streptomyces telluris]NJP79083.1 VWA domain-containing protein [Streptomyces telluris]